MPATNDNRPASNSVRTAEDERKRRRRGAIVWGRTPAGPSGGGGRWSSLDVLSTLAVVLALFGVTGYVNAAPLGAGEDSLDAFYEEVWDHADEAKIEQNSGSMIEMVRAAREDERDYNATRASRAGRQPVVVPPAGDPGATPTPGGPTGIRARPAVQAAGGDRERPILVPGVLAAPPSFTPRTTPTETLTPTPIPTRRETGGGSTRRGSGEPAEDGPPVARPPVRHAAPGVVIGEPVEQRPVLPPTVEPPPDDLVDLTPEPTMLPRPTSVPVVTTLTPNPTLVLPVEPTSAPTQAPTHAPTHEPTETPTSVATSVPTTAPTSAPTEVVTPTPTTIPTQPATPTAPSPTATLTVTPTVSPTTTPTATPTMTPTPVAGAVVIRTDAPATGLFTVGNMRPGACASQNVTVFNAGRLPFASYTLSTAAIGAQTALWSDRTNGLQLRVQRGTTTLYSGPVAVADLDLGVKMASGETDLLTVTVCLPTEAGNALQGQSQTIAITWTATGN